MPISVINGIHLSYEKYGAGDPVVLIAGTGSRGRTFRAHQVPALTRAGYRAITLDNRGVPPTDVCPEGFTLADMTADVVGLIEHLDVGPCRLVGFSLGAIIAQEVALARPDLIDQAVLMGTRGRTDALNAALAAAELERYDQGVKLPPRYEAAVSLLRWFSPRTLRDDQAVRDWLDIFEMSPPSESLSRSQLAMDLLPGRLHDYRRIEPECLILAFSDDVVTPPHLGREVAETIPRGTYREITGCGHYGHLENPDAVNAAIVDFFGRGTDVPGSGRRSWPG
ncbi:alpha/beta fold hydrolase [Streptomyces sp. 4F14]|uniref:alpha/beta fold hydrolase n=1 Tax=Streptomyces sp. 4F14 TaxID=3394380 RepID=UPI003A86EC94